MSIDHMISKQPGLVPRQDGRHSLARFEGATVYMLTMILNLDTLIFKLVWTWIKL